MGGVIMRGRGVTGRLGVVERDRHVDSDLRLQSGDDCFLCVEQGDIDDFDPRSVLHVLVEPRRDMKARGDDVSVGGGVADSERFTILERRLCAGVGTSRSCPDNKGNEREDCSSCCATKV